MTIKEFSFDESPVNEKITGFTHSSSFVGNVQWDSSNNQMRVILNGKHYDFCDVPARIFDAFEGSTSKGKYFNNSIKEQFDCSIGSSGKTVKEVVVDEEKAQFVQKVLELSNSLQSQGIPPCEIMRVVKAQFSESPMPIHQWPPEIIGVDTIPIPDINQVFDSGYPPVLPDPQDSQKSTFETVAIPDSLSNQDVLHTPQGNIQDLTNYLATGSKENSEPSMHNQEGWVGSKSIPEERYQVSMPKPVMEAIRETVSNLRLEFDWASDDYLLGLKERITKMGGKLYLIRAAEETITDHRSEGALLRRKLDSRELFAMARTAIGKDIDINHYGRGYVTGGNVIDAEYSDGNQKLQMIFWETDPEIINAITNGIISTVSINAGKPRTRDIEPCDGTGTEMCDVPKGLVLGELDGIAITYVVTQPGFMWRGKPIPIAKPGVATTAIEEF